MAPAPVAAPARIALVNMPFGGADRPALGLSLLKAALARAGLGCDLHYLNLAFAHRVGLARYERLSMLDGRQLRGEQLFAEAVFGPGWPTAPGPAPGQPVAFGQSDLWDDPEAWPALSAAVAPFLEACLASIPWGQYTLIGFSTTFEQNLASLALAKQIKQRWPAAVIIFGGANCEGEMGLELHRQFPFIDLVCSGEGDQLFPIVARQVLAGAAPAPMPGLITRVGGVSRTLGNGAPPIADLEALPYPDFDDFFAQYAHSGLEAADLLMLPVETSRGCWYGAKQHCTFCGLNGATLAYRSKRPARAVAEINHLVARYQVTTLAATDNILDLSYLATVAPALAERAEPLSIHYEVKANLRRDQLEALRQAGIDRLQPGIESLSTPILKLMRKGCTALQNLQLLKWASELGIAVAWNFLMGFPTEPPEAYARMAAQIPALVHLQPPQGYGLIRLDRFSPYFDAPERHGMVNVRPAEGYARVYPFPEPVLRRLAYYFEYDHADGRDPRAYTGPLIDALCEWHAQYTPFGLTYALEGDTLVLRDRRPKAKRAGARLTGARRALYAALDSARPLSAAAAQVRAQGHRLTEARLRAHLQEWEEAGWVAREDEAYLSLAVRLEGLL